MGRTCRARGGARRETALLVCVADRQGARKEKSEVVQEGPRGRRRTRARPRPGLPRAEGRPCVPHSTAGRPSGEAAAERAAERLGGPGGGAERWSSLVGGCRGRAHTGEGRVDGALQETRGQPPRIPRALRSLLWPPAPPWPRCSQAHTQHPGQPPERAVYTGTERVTKESQAVLS